jgi:(2R)-ethylmalonyl-CoA mutase
LEYPDIFEGSIVMNGLVAELLESARAEMAEVERQGGAFEAIEYMKSQLVDSNRERIARIESGEKPVIGVNVYTETETSPLLGGLEASFDTPDQEIESELIEALRQWKQNRDGAAVEQALEELEQAAKNPEINIMHASIKLAQAGGTTGEWAGVLRDVFGDYRGPTGIGDVAGELDNGSVEETRDEISKLVGDDRIKFLVGKPGLDGHSSGAEQIAIRARDVGMNVLYLGIRLTPELIVNAAHQEGADVIGLSVLSGSHREQVGRITTLLREMGMSTPLVLGGTIPEQDAVELIESGEVAAVYTPKDFVLNDIMKDIARIVAERRTASV